MINIAITGSFASGKSFVLNCIKSMGYKVFSCDDYVRELYKSPEIQSLVEHSVKGLASFDKRKLAEIIYNEDSARRSLELIIHPRVRKAIKEFEKENEKEEFLFTEVPLLFESGFDKYFAYSICVFCKEETRIKRAKSRGEETYKMFKKIKKIQLSQEEKKNMANFIVDTEMDADKIKEKLKNIIEVDLK